MKYRSIGKRLSAWRGHTDAKNLLDRLIEELREAFGSNAFTVASRGRRGPLLEERVVLLFPHVQGATSAESWIEAHFEAD